WIIYALVLSGLTHRFVRGEEETFKDRIWLWCHVEGAHNCGGKGKNRQDYKFGGYDFTVSPQEAANLLGIENAFMVKYNIGPNPGPKPENFSDYYDSQHFNAFTKVIWSVVGEGGGSSAKERTSALNLTKAGTNIVGFIMDDFFRKKY